MQSAILALASAVPPNAISQEEVALQMIAILGLKDAKAAQLKQLYANTAIQKRHSIITDFHQFLKAPGMSKRNAIYKADAPKLSYESAQKALKNWGGDPGAITHLIFVTCTGVVAPGIEFHLVSQLGLNPSVQRFAINFMGCFGAFKGLAVASAFAKEDPKNRVLLVCTELCTLHFQTALDQENLTANALFADGSAAAIVGCEEKPLWKIVKSHSLALENTTEKMSWEASDTGYLIRLSPQVPVLIGRTIKAFIQDIHADPSGCDWAIHPGGKSIIQAVEKALGLTSSQTRASWEVLAEYGNMSSATFLFLLEKMVKTGSKPCIGVAFGPGLSMEGILLKR